MRARSPLRLWASAVAATLALLGVVALEQRRGLLGLLVHPRLERPSGVLLYAFLALTIVTLVRRRFAVPPAVLRLSVALTAFVMAAHVHNRIYLAGDGLDVLLGYGALVGWCAAVATGRWSATRLAVPAAAMVGVGYLAATGMLLRQGLDRGAWFDLKNGHVIAGVYTAPLLALYVVRHLGAVASARSRAARVVGELASLSLMGLLMTGLNRAATGGSHFSFGSTRWHRGLAIASVALMALHAVVARFTSRSDAPRRPAPRRVALATVAAGALLAALHGRLPRGPAVARGEVDATPAEHRARLANPRTGVTAASVHGAMIPRALMSPEARAPGCTNTAACHAIEADAWSRSSHRFAVNGTYRAVVEALVREEGVESARLCAGCHDPVPLLAGEMVRGRPYPQASSEGVTCVVCHAARPSDAAGPGAGGGRYRIAAPAEMRRQLGVTAIQGLMVYDHLDAHRATVNDAYLRDDALCVACHDLDLNGVALRSTGREFRALGLRAPNGEPQSCRSCHMPAQPELADEERDPHDHAMLSSNIGVARLSGDDTLAARVRFMASALRLRAHRAGDGLRVELTNAGGGHGFPTAPRDLVRWWLEARVGAEGAWRAVGPASLFPETLRDRAGASLVRHELWRIHAVVHEGERITRGETRAWTLPPVAGATEVRLRYERLPAGFARSLGGSSRGLDAVEVLRAPVEGS